MCGGGGGGRGGGGGGEGGCGQEEGKEFRPLMLEKTGSLQSPLLTYKV